MRDYLHMTFCEYFYDLKGFVTFSEAKFDNVQGVLEGLQKSSSLILRLEINQLAKTGDIFLFWFGHFDI